MLRILPALWFAIAVVSAALQVTLTGGFTAGGPNATAILTSASSALSHAVIAVGFGFVYLLILRTRPSGAAGIIGYSHLFLVTAAFAAQGVGNFMRLQYLANTSGDAGDVVLASFAYTAASVGNLLGGVVFIFALIVALNTRHEPVEEVF